MYRFLDILLSSISILLLFPFLILVIIVLKFTGEGKVFYFQERIGLNGKLFNVIKFATMLENSPNMKNGTITIKNDPRILPFGKILRFTKINELPQLINVLLGKMSIIGPRPLVEKNFLLYPKNYQIIITSVRPGLSGVGSIIFRNEEKWLSENKNIFAFYERIIAPYKGELEKWFINNLNIIIYLKIIIITIIIIIRPNSKIVWRLLPNLPKVPNELKSLLDL